MANFDIIFKAELKLSTHCVIQTIYLVSKCVYTYRYYTLTVVLFVIETNQHRTNN